MDAVDGASAELDRVHGIGVAVHLCIHFLSLSYTLYKVTQIPPSTFGVCASWTGTRSHAHGYDDSYQVSYSKCFAHAFVLVCAGKASRTTALHSVNRQLSDIVARGSPHVISEHGLAGTQDPNIIVFPPKSQP